MDVVFGVFVYVANVGRAVIILPIAFIHLYLLLVIDIIRILCDEFSVEKWLWALAALVFVCECLRV